MLAGWALPHVAQAPISELYHAPGATPEDRATLGLLWQATQGILEALFGVGLVLVTVGLGVIGVVAASVLLVDPLSPSAFVGVLSLIVFHLVLGWKVYCLSRA